MEKIGIIAGGGKFPILIARAAKKRGLKVFAVAYEGEADKELEKEVDGICWLSLGQFGGLIRAFKKEGIDKVMMAGTIKKRRMFGNIKFDLKGISVLAKISFFHDDGILKTVANELLREGIEVISATEFLPEILAPEGCLTKRKPSREEEEDIRFGWRIAKKIGELDIGQCVVVRKKTVVAVETIEGTDETILRGGRLAKEKAVVIKVSKPMQDLRFDLPAVGLSTLKNMAKVRASCLAIEAGKTIIFDREEMISFANQNRISVVSIKEIESWKN